MDFRLYFAPNHFPFSSTKTTQLSQQLIIHVMKKGKFGQTKQVFYLPPFLKKTRVRKLWNEMIFFRLKRSLSRNLHQSLFDSLLQYSRIVERSREKKRQENNKIKFAKKIEKNWHHCLVFFRFGRKPGLLFSLSLGRELPTFFFSAGT